MSAVLDLIPTGRSDADVARCLRQILSGLRVKDAYFPDTGDFRRELFPKSVEFFEATAKYQNINVFGANRCSKSLSLAYAVTCWLTGEYPDWWTGRRFPGKTDIWIAGQTGKLVRDSLQRYLIGTRENPHMGLLRPEQVKSITWVPRPEGLAEKFHVEHVGGGQSICNVKSFDMERKSFQSGTIDVFAFDEEPNAGIYTEAMTRTATRRGLVVGAFTALEGVTPLVAMLAPQFAGGEVEDPDESGKKNIFVGWDDIPYSVLPKAERERLKRIYLPHELKARTEGIPAIGAGLVYPISESQFVVPDFRVPEHWPRLLAMDPGFKAPTAIIDLAYDGDADAIYQVAEYYVEGQPIAVHADWITRRGAWVPVVMDYAGGNITDGKSVMGEYRRAVRNPIHSANKGVFHGHSMVWDRLQTGRFFVFETCRKTLGEFRQYHKKEDGKIAETPSHALDCWRYGVCGIQYAKLPPRSWQNPHPALRQQQAFVPRVIDILDGIFR